MSVPGRRLRGTLALVALAAGCGDPEPAPPSETPGARPPGAGAQEVGDGFPVELLDDEGRQVVLDRAPARIVSLVPSATRALLAMGLGRALVGRTDYDRQAELADRPSVGGGLEPSAERLVALAPDLVVRFAAESDRATPGHLDRAGIPHVAVAPERIEDVRRILRLLGRATGRRSEARALRERMDEELSAVARAVEGAPRPRVAFLLGGDPPWVAGPGTYLDELIGVAGGRNAFADLDFRYGPVSIEEVLRRDLDLILALPDGRIPSALSEVPVRRTSAQLQTPDHRVGDSARMIGRILHPERFP